MKHTLAQKYAMVAACPSKTCVMRQAVGGKHYAVKCDGCLQAEKALKDAVRQAPGFDALSFTQKREALLKAVPA